MATAPDDACRGLLSVSNVRFAAAPRRESSKGLLGWVSLTLNGSVQLTGLTLRRTRARRFALSFPSRRDGSGRERFYARPLNDRARRQIEHAVFGALNLGVAS